MSHHRSFALVAVAALAAATTACSPDVSDATGAGEPTPASTSDVGEAPVDDTADLLPIVARMDTAWQVDMPGVVHQAAADALPLAASCPGASTDVTGTAYATTGPGGTSVTFVTDDGIASCDTIDNAEWCGGGGWPSGSPPFEGLAEAGRAASPCGSDAWFLYAVAPAGASWVVSDLGDERFSYPVNAELPVRVRATGQAGGAVTTVTWYAEDGTQLGESQDIAGYVAG